MKFFIFYDMFIKNFETFDLEYSQAFSKTFLNFALNYKIL